MNSTRDDEVDAREVEKIWTWNCTTPEVTEQCIHDLFAEQALKRPGVPAICAWDGDMTYGELDVLSTKLAGHLVKLGVKSEDIVPLCFEKSMWTVVAMLAVLKAGGAFAPLHPDHPASRREEIMKQTGATVILVLGAERVSLADCKVWEDKVEVMNAYGPTECCIFCTGYVGIEGFESGLLGKPIASVAWVVDPDDHNKLAPIGSVGELLVEGPILARGYLNDAEDERSFH
ncbi:hypothetical protein P3342_007333 [Pyrenophora teres f. teres]|nr:hypothetical protein P3342_007333 [Pyrenophora teres f. teres]